MRAERNHHLMGYGVGVATLLTLVGCAVLTVDVDVYKGSLANHEDIQMEQMAAMAIGAKPLLAELEAEVQVLEEKEKSPASLRATSPS